MEKLQEIVRFFKNQVIKKLSWKNISERERAQEEKLKLAELLAESSFTEKNMLPFATLRN